MKRVFSLAVMTTLALTLIVGLVAAKPTSGKRITWLGVLTQSVDDNIAQGFRLPVKAGAIITEVVEDSPADQAGLMKDDIVVSIDGASVETANDLTSTIKEHSVGDVVTVKVIRDAKEREFKVTLAERTESRTRSGRQFAFGSPDEPIDNDADAPETRAFKFYSQSLSDSYIGVELTSLSDQLKTYFGITGNRGLLVSSVEEDSPAEKAGLKAGDVIVGVDGRDVGDVGDIRDIIGDMKKGDNVSLALVRDRREMTVPVEIATHESGSRHSRAFRALKLPDIGNIPTPDMPRMKGLWLGTRDGTQDMDNLREELSTLRDQLAEMRKQLEDLQNTRK
jgi:C-terminal processing protease CtpA/Prc